MKMASKQGSHIRMADVSVVIPCYCCADTISKAVASVLNQSLLPAELILVEDCSGDATLDTLFALQAQHKKDWIKVLSQRQNQGPGSARNLGWAMAQQSYIAFLDADDAWHPQKIEIQYGWMAVHPDVALTGHVVQVILNDRQLKTGELSISTGEFVPIVPRQVLRSNRFATTSVMLRRRLPQRFVEGKRYSEDYLLWSEICLGGYACYHSENALAYCFKAKYGEAGLGANLLEMEKGELDTYRRLCESGHLGRLSKCMYSVWSIARFLMRLVLKFFQRAKRLIY